MRNSIRKYKIPVIILLIFLTVLAVDLLIWRLDTNSNKKSVEALSSKIGSISNSSSQGVYEDCRVSQNKSFKTTSCSILKDVIIHPDTDIGSELRSVFAELKNQAWDANFEEFKTELIEGRSRFNNQNVRFYHDDYDPNGDHDFIDVYRVDNGMTLQNIGIESPSHASTDTDLVVLRFHRYQKSSVSHYIIGQFINF